MQGLWPKIFPVIQKEEVSLNIWREHPGKCCNGPEVYIHPACLAEKLNGNCGKSWLPYVRPVESRLGIHSPETTGLGLVLVFFDLLSGLASASAGAQSLWVSSGGVALARCPSQACCSPTWARARAASSLSWGAPRAHVVPAPF